MWIYAKDDENNIWKSDFNFVMNDMVNALTRDSPIKAVALTEEDVLDWAMENSIEYPWILVERDTLSVIKQPYHITFSMVIVNEADAIPSLHR